MLRRVIHTLKPAIIAAIVTLYCLGLMFGGDDPSTLPTAREFGRVH